MHIMTVIGARPQFIKAATVSRALSDFSNIQESIVHTGQHFDANMSDVFFDEMQIPKPKFHLGVSGLSHGAMTGEMLKGLEEIFLKEKPDVVLVYGDTNSTLAGSLAAAKLHIPLAHVEAGLRSFNVRMPEEVNRILTDRISNFLFCPTETAVKNLTLEGYDNIHTAQVFRTGDVMFDAALFYSQKSENRAKVFKELKPSHFVLVTIHRQENTDLLERLQSIFSALRTIAKEKQVVLPLHPRTKKFIVQYNIPTTGITLLDPVGYFDMLEFLKNCDFVLTDSGGLQKEAYFFNKLCITMRDETEWIELLDVGHNQLVGANDRKILNAYSLLVQQKPNWPQGIYGDGKAAHQILKILQK